MNIKKKLALVCLTIFFVVMIGSLGFYILYGGQYHFMDCIFMTVITLSSIGYGEIVPVSGNIKAEIYTTLLIIFGMGFLLYGTSMLTALLVEGELSGLLKRKYMQKLISELRNHYIICGGGETGRPLITELLRNKEKIVLIEQNEEMIQRCNAEKEIFYIKGDATDDQNLISAGIDRASGIIICLPSDKDNLYVTMTARMLNKQIRIISRMTDPKIEEKLRKAGADHVVSPNIVGALRMASIMIRPTVVDFLDKMLRSGQGTIRIHEIKISKNSKLIGKTIVQSGIKDQFNLLILGLRNECEEILFNPPPATELKEGMILIVMGEMNNIEKAKIHY